MTFHDLLTWWLARSHKPEPNPCPIHDIWWALKHPFYRCPWH